MTFFTQDTVHHFEFSVGTLSRVIKVYQECIQKNVLTCIALYCHVLPCSAIYCHVLPCIATHCHVLPCIAMYYHV